VIPGECFVKICLHNPQKVIMPPYAPLVSLNRSQNVRIGRGLGNSVPNEFDMGDETFNPQNDRLFHAFYADLGQGAVRRDIQRHTSLGSIYPVSGLTSSKWSDLYSSVSSPVSAGTGLTVNVSALTLTSRLFATSLAVAATTGLSIPVLGGNAYYLVYVDGNGVVGAGPGAQAPSTGSIAEVDSVATTGTPTGGTFTLSFVYNGFNYTTATIAYNAIATAVASAVSAATSTNGGPALPGSFTGTAGPLPTAVTLTASATLQGSLSALTTLL
jgi:hypothetical protein